MCILHALCTLSCCVSSNDNLNLFGGLVGKFGGQGTRLLNIQRFVSDKSDDFHLG